ncbi:hypothetical protein PINS_up000283 [Pythium insidiosum]|nr:hypothetical protein PINS_up000283 [Pythium insidiosum]
MEILRQLPVFPFARPRASDAQLTAEEELRFGYEWVQIDEPVGFLLPQIKPQRQLLQLDQVNHVLHYDQHRRCMRISDITLVAAVEELGSDGQLHWWMSIQDSSPQVWLIRFASLARLTFWVDLLRAIVEATKSKAVVGDVVFADASPMDDVMILPDVAAWALEGNS